MINGSGLTIISEHEGHEINGSILVVEEKEELSNSLINRRR